MTTTEAQQIESHRDDLDALHPTHEIAGAKRQARARMRHENARPLREEPAPRDFAADFAKLFGSE